jgi:hypothetical protein
MCPSVSTPSLKQSDSTPCTNENKNSDWLLASSLNRSMGCKSRLIKCHVTSCIVTGMVHMHLRFRPARYSRIGRFPEENKIGGCVSRASSVTSPLFGHLSTQHPLYQSRYRRGQKRRRRQLHRSTPSPVEGGAAEVFFNFGFVLQIRDGGLKWRRYITMPSGSFCPYNYCLAMSVDLADSHYRSICLGRQMSLIHQAAALVAMI